jgi:hypothetical protein
MKYEWSYPNLADAAEDVLNNAEVDESGDYFRQLLNPAFLKDEIAKLIDTSPAEAKWEERNFALVDGDDEHEYYLVQSLTNQEGPAVFGFGVSGVERVMSCSKRPRTRYNEFE